MDERLIRKHYGEKMWHFCRENFSLLLEKPNFLYEILDKTFQHSHELYDDLKKECQLSRFVDFIYDLSGVERECYYKTEETPEELLRKVGYTLYRCKTEKEIQSFKKYYADKEELCTFRGGRLDTCHVFFAVKDNADKLDRKSFTNPNRQDEYGTSVISIQFTKNDSNILSIKNRYNHTVDNPDATFSNDLENIIPGLTYSFEKYYGLKQKVSTGLTLDNYAYANDKKIYKYSIEKDNIHYCKDNVILDNYEPVFDYINKSKYLLIDTYIIDFETKKIFSLFESDDDFLRVESDIKKVEVTKDKEYRWITLYHENGISKIKILGNSIIEYYNDYIDEIKDNFMEDNESLSKISLANVKKIGRNFISNDKTPVEFNLPKVESVGECFLSRTVGTENVSMPELKEIGYDFLHSSVNTKTVSLPKAETIEDNFMSGNEIIENIFVPKVKSIGDGFLRYNTKLSEINLDEVLYIGSTFLLFNNKVERISFPKVETIDSDFLRFNKKIKSVYLPNIETIGSAFLAINKDLEEIDLPNLTYVFSDFLQSNEKIKIINFPKLEIAHANFLKNNECVEEVNLPSIDTIGTDAFRFNFMIKKINMPSVRFIGNKVFENVEHLDELNLGEIEYLGSDFLNNCENIDDLNLKEKFFKKGQKTRW